MTASHEIAEMLVDPAIQLGARGPDGSTWYAYEMCGRSSSARNSTSTALRWSNFVFPAWFEGFRWARSTRFDYLDNCTQPFELRPGGYISIYTDGAWQQKFGSPQAERSFDLQRHPRANVRALVMRHRSEARRPAVEPARGKRDASARPTSAPTQEEPQN